jgi:hypothetical protein
LKIVGEISSRNCTANEYFEATITVSNGARNGRVKIDIPKCIEGAEARMNSLKSTLDDFNWLEASLVGSSTLVLAFAPNIENVQIIVPQYCESNVYGLKNETKKKTAFHFVNGFSSLGASFEVTGHALVSASIAGSVEAGANISSHMKGSLLLEAGTRGKFIPIENWFSNVKSIVDKDDDFRDPDFAKALLTVDGSFDATLQIREPFQFDGPSLVKASFVTPYQVDLIDLFMDDNADARQNTPDIQVEGLLPTLWDLKNFRLVQMCCLANCICSPKLFHQY